jgi:hypothetical protein
LQVGEHGEVDAGALADAGEEDELAALQARSRKTRSWDRPDAAGQFVDRPEDFAFEALDGGASFSELVGISTFITPSDGGNVNEKQWHTLHSSNHGCLHLGYFFPYLPIGNGLWPLRPVLCPFPVHGQAFCLAD